ncbi:D-Ala-D-Ala carboxypeptidase family metallohydrolase [Microvirga makkahensis]|uniref:DUF882 domain-containing protein n=1 Tax=Microvirga makkahensis TaxID=1128670 RepID=A0A7X3MRR5_9HYPH|nr:D-Ala-D-Ala carboxypeptidase family metallohydrolase [Microvirga makkahensis]MXQ11800.1 DUF882 domain-containing protein [Microvirga makkahensis]
MSTEVKTRRAPWLVFVTGACLAAFLPHPADAQNLHPEPSGIVIPLPLSNAPAASAGVRRSKAPPRSKARSKAVPKVEYASLPSHDRNSDPASTGSLPEAGTLGKHAPPGFASLVSRGTIKLRATAPTRCLPGNLLAVLADLAVKFGPVSIESTHRGKNRNRRAGGARRSLHLSCRAIDFRVKGRTRGIMAYLSARPEVGGLKRYRNGIIHIDNGERRSW